MNSEPIHQPIPYKPDFVSAESASKRGLEFLERMDARRSVRFFADTPVPRELIEIAIRTASTAPSGAHRQPWKFVGISDPEVKHQIRIAAEKEEYESYEGGRMSPEWRQALKPIGTTWQKPFLETVPWIVVIFEETYGLHDNGEKRKNYYVKESVGIATGMFITAIHQMGLSTLTHTPSPMNFLSKILRRGPNERPFVMLPIGYAATDATVPDLHRKPLDEISVWFDRE